MDWLNTDFDPYAAILQLQHDVEQLSYHQQNAATVIQQQSQLIQQLSQNFLVIVRHLEQLENKIEEANEK